MRIVIALMLVPLLAGCALVTKPADTITIERQQFLQAYARVRVVYDRAADIARRACAAGQWPRAECDKAATLHGQARKIAAEIDAKIAVPDSRMDWERILKLLELAVDILA